MKRRKVKERMGTTKIERALKNYSKIKQLEIRKISNELSKKLIAQREKKYGIQAIESEIRKLRKKVEEIQHKHPVDSYSISNELRRQFDEWFCEFELKVLTESLEKDNISEEMKFEFDLTKFKVK